MNRSNAKPRTRAEELRAQRSAGNNRKTGRQTPRAYDAIADAAAATLQPIIGGNKSSGRSKFTGGGAAPTVRPVTPAPRDTRGVVTPSVRAAAPTPSRPVTVRNISSPRINNVYATSNPRRAYYLSLNAPGAEMRLPSLPAIHVGWRLFSAAILLAAAFGIFSLGFSPFFQVGPVEITGLERLTQTDLEAVIDVENLPIVQVDPRQVEENLLARFTSLEAVHATVSLPTHVSIAVKERAPVLAWKQGETIQWVDSKGVLFQPNGDAGALATVYSPESAPAVLADSPLAPDDADAPGEPGPAYLEPTIFTTALLLAQRLPEGTPLVYTEANGLGWEDASGYDVYLGYDLSNFEEKFSVVQHIAAKLTEQGFRPELINAKNADAPYYRLEN